MAEATTEASSLIRLGDATKDDISEMSKRFIISSWDVKDIYVYLEHLMNAKEPYLDLDLGQAFLRKAYFQTDPAKKPIGLAVWHIVRSSPYREASKGLGAEDNDWGKLLSLRLAVDCDQ